MEKKEFKSFREDLKQLLEKHWAELSIEDGTIIVWLNTIADQEEICRGVTNNEVVAVTSKDFN